MFESFSKCRGGFRSVKANMGFGHHGEEKGEDDEDSRDFIRIQVLDPNSNQKNI